MCLFPDVVCGSQFLTLFVGIMISLIANDDSDKVGSEDKAVVAVLVVILNFTTGIHTCMPLQL